MELPPKLPKAEEDWPKAGVPAPNAAVLCPKESPPPNGLLPEAPKGDVEAPNAGVLLTPNAGVDDCPKPAHAHPCVVHSLRLNSLVKRILQPLSSSLLWILKSRGHEPGVPKVPNVGVEACWPKAGVDAPKGEGDWPKGEVLVEAPKVPPKPVCCGPVLLPFTPACIRKTISRAWKSWDLLNIL